MSQAMIAFLFGMVVGGLGGVLLIGLFSLLGEREKKTEVIEKPFGALQASPGLTCRTLARHDL